jgi:hypothetical protein
VGELLTPFVRVAFKQPGNETVKLMRQAGIAVELLQESQRVLIDHVNGPPAFSGGNHPFQAGAIVHCDLTVVKDLGFGRRQSHISSFN